MAPGLLGSWAPGGVVAWWRGGGSWPWLLGLLGVLRSGWGCSWARSWFGVLPCYVMFIIAMLNIIHQCQTRFRGPARGAPGGRRRHGTLLPFEISGGILPDIKISGTLPYFQNFRGQRPAYTHGAPTIIFDFNIIFPDLAHFCPFMQVILFDIHSFAKYARRYATWPLRFATDINATRKPVLPPRRPPPRRKRNRNRKRNWKWKWNKELEEGSGNGMRNKSLAARKNEIASRAEKRDRLPRRKTKLRREITFSAAQKPKRAIRTEKRYRAISWAKRSEIWHEKTNRGHFLQNSQFILLSFVHFSILKFILLSATM